MTANNNDGIEIETTASYLYDGGWRSTDRDLIIEEYGISGARADAICDRLAGIEEFSGREKKEPGFFTDSEGLLRMGVSE